MDTKEYDRLFNIVKCQTDFSDDIIHSKMKEYNNDYLKVIKEYMNITKETSSTVKYNTRENVSINQQIYHNIREFMDTAVNDYEIRKLDKDSNNEKM